MVSLYLSVLCSVIRVDIQEKNGVADAVVIPAADYEDVLFAATLLLLLGFRAATLLLLLGFRAATLLLLLGFRAATLMLLLFFRAAT